MAAPMATTRPIFTTVQPSQRYTRFRPCPICGGFDSQRRGRSERCYGYVTESGHTAYCSREELAGALPQSGPLSTYAHQLQDACPCGHVHGEQYTAPAPARTSSPKPAATPATRSATRSHRRQTPDRAYVYHNADGSERFRVLRIGQSGKDKRFVQQRPDGAGDWLDGLDGLAPTLYRLPDLMAAPMHRPVFVVEGEKCADALAALGLVATTSAGGALKWERAEGRHDALRGRCVVVLPDNDKPGRAHARAVAADLQTTAKSVRILALPGLPDKGDVYDWLQRGGTAIELHELALTIAVETGAPDGEEDAGEDAAEAEDGEELTPSATPGTDPVTYNTVVHLRARDAWDRKLQANANIPNPYKALIAKIRDEWDSGRARRGPHNSLRIARSVWANHLSTSVTTITRQLELVEQAGLVRREHDVTYDEQTGLARRHLSIVPTPALLDQIQDAEVVPPARGGARVRCRHCGSDDVHVVCKHCGASDPLNAPADDGDQADERREQRASVRSRNNSPAINLNQSDRWGKHAPDSAAPAAPVERAPQSPPVSDKGAAAGYGYALTRKPWGSDMPPEPTPATCDHPPHARVTLHGGVSTCGHCGARGNLDLDLDPDPEEEHAS